MIIIAYLFVASIVTFTFFYIIGISIERNLNDSHPIKKFWRKQVITTDRYYDEMDKKLDEKGE